MSGTHWHNEYAGGVLGPMIFGCIKHQAVMFYDDESLSTQVSKTTPSTVCLQ